jgi:hypothetical protein
MRTRNFVIATGTAIALVAGGSTAVAATMAASSPVNSSGTISACYTTKATKAGAFAVALQNTGTACPNGTTAISWNQTGPMGPAGLDVTFVISGPGTGSASAFCPASHPYIVGGGGNAFVSIVGGTRNTALAYSVPLIPGQTEGSGTAQGWQAFAVGSTDAVHAEALCAKLGKAATACPSPRSRWRARSPRPGASRRAPASVRPVRSLGG